MFFPVVSYSKNMEIISVFGDFFTNTLCHLSFYDLALRQIVVEFCLKHIQIRFWVDVLAEVSFQW